jgi:hypothetical protein
VTDYAPNYTSRLFVEYRAAGRTHKTSFRYGDVAGPPPGSFISSLNDMLVPIANLLVEDFAILSASYIPLASTVALPTTAPTAPAGAGVAFTPGDAPRFISFTYKGLDGTAGRFTFFGATKDPGDSSDAAAQDYRILRAENAVVATALDKLALVDGMTTISGASFIINQYVNLGYNAYWQRRARRG